MKDILIVEDGRQERERLKQLFTKAGYTVVACETVGKAEEVLQNDRFRLAVLDIGLNDRSGSYLFSSIKKSAKVPYVIIFTGNPSVHLKQRFLEEGAADYIVKASSQAQNDNFLQRVQELLGEDASVSKDGIPLAEFLRFIDDKSKKLFFDLENSFPECPSCSAREYVVSFSHQTQMPPEVTGSVVCSVCGKLMDPDIE